MNRVEDDPEGHLRPTPPPINRIKYDPSVPQLYLGDERMDMLAYERYKHGFDWEDHARQEDETAEQFARELNAAKSALAHKLAGQATAMPAENAQSALLPDRDGLAHRLRVILQPAFEYGYRAVWRERKHQTGRKHGSRAADSRSQDVIQEIVNGRVKDFVNCTGALIVEAATEGRKNGLEPSQIEQEVETRLISAPDEPIGRISKEAARQAVLTGRTEAMRELQDEIVDYERVEVLESDACPPCKAAYGMRWKRLEDVAWRAGDDCENGKSCRGRLLANFRKE